MTPTVTINKTRDTQIGFRKFWDSDDKRTFLENLAQLALFVLRREEDIKETFNMSTFLRDPAEPIRTYQGITYACRKSEHPCGTVACFAGHGPEAGIEPLYNLINDAGEPIQEEWNSYVTRVFLPEELENQRGESPAFDTLFGADHPDNPRKAVVRTYRFMRGGDVEYCNEIDDTPEEDLEESKAGMEAFFEAVMEGNFELESVIS